MAHRAVEDLAGDQTTSSPVVGIPHRKRVDRSWLMRSLVSSTECVVDREDGARAMSIAVAAGGISMARMSRSNCSRTSTGIAPEIRAEAAVGWPPPPNRWATGRHGAGEVRAQDQVDVGWTHQHHRADADIEDLDPPVDHEGGLLVVPVHLDHREGDRDAGDVDLLGRLHHPVEELELLRLQGLEDPAPYPGQRCPCSMSQAPTRRSSGVVSRYERPPVSS